MTTLEIWIAKHHRRLTFGLFLQRAGEWLAVYFLVFGACVLTAKLFLTQFWPHVLWLSLGVLPVLAFALWFARKAEFSRMESVALLDRQLNGGGLIMSLAETEGQTQEEPWQDRLPQTPELWKRKLPKLRPARFFRLITWPMVFALGTLLIPLRSSETVMAASPEVGRKATSELVDMLSVMEATGVLPPEQAQELKTVVDQLQTQADEGPLRNEDWETIDRVTKRFDNTLGKNEADIARAKEFVEKLSKSQGADLEGLLAGNPAEMQKMMGLLQSLSKREGAKGEGTSPLPQFDQLLGQARQELAKNPELRNQLLGQAQSLLSNRTLDLEKLRTQMNRTLTQRPNRQRNPMRSEGGTSDTRPTDDNPTGTNWGTETAEKRAKFKQVVLPPGFAENKANTGSVRNSAKPRTVRPSENLSPKERTQFDSATGKEIRTGELRPRHRELRKKYFSSDESPAKK